MFCNRTCHSLSEKNILYSGDSAWTDLFVEHAKGVDLFLCECSFFDQGTGNHLSYLTLRSYLPRLECKKLIITHLGIDMLGHREEIPLSMAEDGMIVDI